MAKKPKDKFFKSRMKQREAFGADAAELRDVESLYTNMLSILKEMGTANQKRLDQLKQEGNLYKQTKKLANEIYNKQFQRQDLEDQILEAIAKGNTEEAKRLKNDPLIRKYDTQIQSITKDLMRGVEKARKTDPQLDKIIKGIESGKYDK